MTPVLVADCDFLAGDLDGVQQQLAGGLLKEMERETLRVLGFPGNVVNPAPRYTEPETLWPPIDLEVYRPDPRRLFWPWYAGVVLSPPSSLIVTTAASEDEPFIAKPFGVKTNKPGEWRALQVVARRLGAHRRWLKLVTREREKRVWNRKRRQKT